MSFIKYKIREHLFSFKPRYTITDEFDKPIATVHKHLFSPHKKATVYNEMEEEVMVITKKIFSLRRTYYLEKRGKQEFRIFKTLQFKPKIFVESLMEPEAFMIQGNIWSSEYAFYKNDNEFAFVTREIWKIPDTYMAAIRNDQDQYLILSMVVVIDLLKRSRKKS